MVDLANCLSYKARYRKNDREKDRVTGSRGRRRKQLLDDLKEKRVYWKLKDGSRSYVV